MTQITINVEDNLFERFNSICNALGIDEGIVGFLEGHARDAMVNKLADLAEQFGDPRPEVDVSKASYYPNLEGWLARRFKVKLAAIEKAVDATPGKVLNFPEKASEYLVTKFDKPGTDTSHYQGDIGELIEKDEEEANERYKAVCQGLDAGPVEPKK